MTRSSAGQGPLSAHENTLTRGMCERKLQRALLLFFKPENWFTVREALIDAGRQDLIGSGCDCLIPAIPPKEDIEARRKRADDDDHYHTFANPAKREKPGERGAGQPKTKGYRPGRKSQSRRQKPGRG